MRKNFFKLFIVIFTLALSPTVLASKVAKPVNSEKATFAVGCFWGAEEFFRKVPGIFETGVGYAGGTKINPTYVEVSTGSTGHAESVEILFDPKKVSYEKLLDLFYKMHDPTTLNAQGNDKGTQYRSIIFYHSEQQRKIAEAFKIKVEKSVRLNNSWVIC